MEQELAQIQNRLLNLATQLEHLEGLVEHLNTDVQTSSMQVSTLVRHMTDPQGLHDVSEQLAEMMARQDNYQENFGAVVQTLTNVAQQTANLTQLDQMAKSVNQTVTNLVESQQQLDKLSSSLQRLSRTQFKTNALTEKKEQQIDNSFSIFQDMLTKKDELQNVQTEQTRLRHAQIRRESRVEVATQLLPALDSLALALESGYTLSEKQNTQAETTRQQAQQNAQQRAHQATSLSVPAPPPQPSFLQRIGLASAPASTPAPAPPPVIIEDMGQVEALSQTLEQSSESIEAWLRGLELVRDRFVTLLKNEDIEEIDALDQLFDPRLHVAVDFETREDVPNNSIIRVLRKGYHQDERVVRYAEVVIARSSQPEPTTVPATVPVLEPLPEPKPEPEPVMEPEPEPVVAPEPVPVTVPELEPVPEKIKPLTIPVQSAQDMSSNAHQYM
ncbi:MAG: nucleotide exchange factor GrpE [Chloroflexota bacterium]